MAIWYEVHLPQFDEPWWHSNVRQCRLPFGTFVYAIKTNSNGKVINRWRIPVIHGRALFWKGRDALAATQRETAQRAPRGADGEAGE